MGLFFIGPIIVLKAWKSQLRKKQKTSRKTYSVVRIYVTRSWLCSGDGCCITPRLDIMKNELERLDREWNGCKFMWSCQKIINQYLWLKCGWAERVILTLFGLWARHDGCSTQHHSSLWRHFILTIFRFCFDDEVTLDHKVLQTRSSRGK